VVGRRQVQQAVRPLHRLAAGVGIANVALDEAIVGHARGRLDQVEDGGLVPVGRQPLAEVRADETRAASDTKPHLWNPPTRSAGNNPIGFS